MDSPFYISYKIKWDSLPRAEMNDALFIWDLIELSRRRFPTDQFDRWRIINMGCNLMLYYCRPICQQPNWATISGVWHAIKNHLTLHQHNLKLQYYMISSRNKHTQLNAIITSNSLYFQICIFLHQLTFHYIIPNLHSPRQDLVVFTMYQLSECSSYILLHQTLHKIDQLDFMII